MAAPESFPAAEYLRLKGVWRGSFQRGTRKRLRSAPGTSVPFSKGRDPNPLGTVLQAVVHDMGWAGELGQAQVIEEWPKFAGEAIAEHTKVLGVVRGVLQVQCDSTTWATELRRLRQAMMTRLIEEYPDAGIQDMRFLPPGAPTWRHGNRVIRGRGPRDTYG